MKVTNVKVYPIKDPKNSLIAGLSITFDDAMDMKCTLFNGVKGPFVNFPPGTTYEKDGKTVYPKNVFITDETLLAEVNAAAVDGWNSHTDTSETLTVQAKKSTDDMPF